jgi:membrane protein implicated in regulation of membrane protease activity
MLESLLQPATFWFAIGVVLLCLELITPAFLLFFFGVGGIVTGIACLLGAPSFNQQLLIFMITSISTLISLRRFLRPVQKGTPTGTRVDADEFKGKTAVVLEPILPPKTGKVELHGTAWRAESAEALPVGTPVTVLSRDNMTVRVQKTIS